MTNDTYTPKPDSFPAKVLAWFEQNPEEELSREDIGRKFNLAPSQVSLGLEKCVKAGLLWHERNAQLDYVYTLPTGNKQQAAQPTASPGVLSSAWPAAKPELKPHKKLVVTPSMLDTLKVEKGVPIQRGGTELGVGKWDKLFDKLTEPDTSVQIPADWKTAVAAEATKRNRKAMKQGCEAPRYATGHTGPGTARLWRVA